MYSSAKWTAMAILLACWMSVTLWALPESPHPYPNNYDQTQSFSRPGVVGLEVTFSPESCLEEGDYVLIRDRHHRLLGTYTRLALANLTLIVEGDTLHIQLVSDDSKNGYGYAVASIRAIFSRQAQRAIVYDYTKADQMSDDDLKQELYNLVKDHVSLGYTLARQKMFGEIDNDGGQVQCVYTGRWVQTTVIPDPNDMNTEHTWPQSLGAQNEPARSDLYHLFPTDSETNSRRASYPFGTVTTVTWTKGNSSLGKNSSGAIVFMPRPEHRGNVARAIFYFSIRYRLPVDATQESVLKQWNRDDSVDNPERTRNDAVAEYQKNRNPFVDHPEYVDRIADF